MSDSNFIVAFLQQVEKRPHKTAIEFEGRKISYKGLFEEARLVCEQLKSDSVHQKDIGIRVGNGFQTYANIIGTWMYGAAYVPLHAGIPELTRTRIISELNIQTVLSNDTKDDSKKRESSEFSNEVNVGDLAYVIYTSGSTGTPKGVTVSHENLNALTAHYLNKSKYDFNSDDRFLQSYDLSFDVSVFCFTIPLMIGATLVLPVDKGVKYMTILSSILKDKITVCSNVPSVAKYAFPRLAEIKMDSLRYCFFSGEAFYGDWALAWMNAAKDAQVYNCYGPTETTIVCTSEHLNLLDPRYFESSEPLPLGEPFESMELRIHKGEVCFKGAQVFDGYVGDTKLKVTKDGFFPTGDMALVDEQGKLIFKGRSDEQIQINGYRVELRAVDALILDEFDLSSKTLVIKDNEKTDKIFTVIETNEVQVSLIMNYLKNYLPEYSLPKLILTRPTLPLNKNDKLDVAALKKWVIGKV